jgi:hypothetical protein
MGLNRSSPVIWNGTIAKVLTAQLSLGDGALATPGICFTSETNSGLYRAGAGDLILGITGTIGFEVNKLSSTQFNWGFGGIASGTPGNALSWAYTFNGIASFNYSNLSQGTSAVTQFYIGAGASGGAGITIENQAYATTAYTGGGGLLSAGPNLSFLNICAENTGAYMTFNVGGRTLATEAMRLGLTGTGLTLNKGWGKLILSGATSGSLTQTAGATGSVALNYPTANAAGAMYVDVSGNMSFGNLPVNLGGTGSGSVITVPAATTWAGWDANVNLSAANLIDGYTTTATAAGTTTLVVGSNSQQFFTGSTTQTVLLPVTSTLVAGQSFTIVNLSSGIVTVQSSGANTIQAMAANTQLVVTVILTSGTGTASWSWAYSALATSLPVANPMTTGGDLIYGGASGVMTRLANGSANQLLQSQGSTSAPAWKTLTLTNQGFSATGTTSGQIFTITSGSATVGATYTNNAQTFTVLATIAAQTTLWCSSAGSPSASGTLTKSGGTGDATIAFSAAQALATYTTPAGCTRIKITAVGGGGGGGGCATASGACGTGGGGGGGGGLVKNITTPAATYFYAVGGGGAGGLAGNNAGTAGGITYFSTSYSAPLNSSGGSGGGGGAASSTVGNVGGGGAGGVGANSDANYTGCTGTNGYIFSATNAQGGGGGASALAFGPSLLPQAGVSQTGTSGISYGGGGNGGIQVNNGGTKAGGPGAGGYLLIEESYT